MFLYFLCFPHLVFVDNFCCYWRLSLSLCTRLFLISFNLRLCRQFNQACDGFFTKKSLCKCSNLPLGLGQTLSHLSISTEEGFHLFWCDTDFFFLDNFIKYELTFHSLFGIRFELLHIF